MHGKTSVEVDLVLPNSAEADVRHPQKKQEEKKKTKRSFRATGSKVANDRDRFLLPSLHKIPWFVDEGKRSKTFADPLLPNMKFFTAAINLVALLASSVHAACTESKTLEINSARKLAFTGFDPSVTRYGSCRLLVLNMFALDCNTF
jgi:hypothetical protein